MTDRELLELAAKAAGIKFYALSRGGARYAPQPGIMQPYVYWNPLADDGDALRLAVKLKIDVAHTNIHAPQVHALADAKVQVWEETKDDPDAATRRAIVRAAAEIGRNMK